ncbi:hypothetical protein LguiB_013549 [Lonicera macranthoides]
MKKLITGLLIHLMILIAFSILGFSQGNMVPCAYDKTRKCHLACDSSRVGGCEPRRGN